MDSRCYEQEQDRAKLEDPMFQREAQLVEESLEVEKKRMMKQAWGIFTLLAVLTIALICVLILNRTYQQVERHNYSDLTPDLKDASATRSQQKQGMIQNSPIDHLQIDKKDKSNTSPSNVIRTKINNIKKDSSPEKGRLIVGTKTKTESIKVTSLDPNIDVQIAEYVERRRKHYLDYYSFYETNPDPKLDANLIKANISNDQYLLSISLIQHAPIPIDAAIRGLELTAFEGLHPTYTSQVAELPICLIVPSYKNFPYFRYYFNLHTILQQNYTNYHVVIIDDASDDGTALGIEHELNKLDKSKRDKIVFIKNTQRVYHMQNIVEAVRGYCKSGQILMIVDGDDELVGTQVFHTFNAAFHQTKGMSIYSNHLRIRKETTVMIGVSQPYPDEVKQNNSYRTAPHLYSHLKATWVDLFLLIRNESLQNQQGVWFDNAVDNAIFYSLFELSCGRVYYIPEITYKYNYMTGNNLYAKQKFRYRKNTTRQIMSKEYYKCVQQQNLEVYNKIESYYK